MGEGRKGGNPKFDALLEQMREMHNKKNHDYAEEGNPYSNFEYAAKVAGVGVDQIFLTMLGVKLARLVELLKGKTPNNESINDTRLDLAVYAALYASYYGESKDHQILRELYMDGTPTVTDAQVHYTERPRALLVSQYPGESAMEYAIRCMDAQKLAWGKTVEDNQL